MEECSRALFGLHNIFIVFVNTKVYPHLIRIDAKLSSKIRKKHGVIVYRERSVETACMRLDIYIRFSCL